MQRLWWNWTLPENAGEVLRRLRLGDLKLLAYVMDALRGNTNVFETVVIPPCAEGSGIYAVTLGDPLPIHGSPVPALISMLPYGSLPVQFVRGPSSDTPDHPARGARERADVIVMLPQILFGDAPPFELGEWIPPDDGQDVPEDATDTTEARLPQSLAQCAEPGSECAMLRQRVADVVSDRDYLRQALAAALTTTQKLLPERIPSRPWWQFWRRGD